MILWHTGINRDKVVTEKLARAGEILDIKMLDHIIIAGGTGEMYGFREHGLMDQIHRSARSWRATFRGWGRCYGEISRCV